MPDENSIINALHQAVSRAQRLQTEIQEITGQPVNELDQARREIAEIVELRKIIAAQGAKIAEYEAKERHHQAAVDLAAERSAEVQNLHQAIETLTDHNVRLLTRLHAARSWAATWKAAAKVKFAACRSLGSSVGRLTQRNATLTRERNALAGSSDYFADVARRLDRSAGRMRRRSRLMARKIISLTGERDAARCWASLWKRAARFERRHRVIAPIGGARWGEHR